jgi:hypothetical protein
VLITKIAILISSSALLLSATVASADAAPAKAKKASHKAGRGSYFVPPPPPYQPSILPEMSGAGEEDSVAAAETKTVKPYSKYIYVRNQSDAPRVVQQPNKYVTYWRGASSQ